MGTNYYAVRNKPSVESPIHIGKSSIGWLFLFHAHTEPYHNPPVVWQSYDQVKGWLKKYTVESDEYVIMDEYDEIIPYKGFIKMVQLKQNDWCCRTGNPLNFESCRNVDGYRFTDEEFC